MSTETTHELLPIYPHGELLIGEEHYPPAEVRIKLLEWSAHRPVQFSDVMRALRWDSMNGCWAFYYTGIFHGVEADGYIHT